MSGPVTDAALFAVSEAFETDMPRARVLRAHTSKRALQNEDRLTEAGAAERFAKLHGDDIRFDHRRNRWLMWERHRWTPDVDAAVTRLALGFARDWQHEAVGISDRDRREKVFRAALRLERRDALHSMLALARDFGPIADRGERWDQDLWLLGVPNGVIDLRTGTLRPGRREDRITMSTGVHFDPDATCPRWKRFLTEVFAGDEELVGFVRRAAGYSIAGVTSEQCVLVLYGTGANGKTTLVAGLRCVLGDYAWNMPFSTIEMRDRAAIPNDLAALVNRRFVIASETNDGARLNEARIKALTGSDPITARFLHSEFFTFEPAAKFWLSVNHKPVVRDDSFGFWRRIRLIPFTETFPVNPKVGDELKAEAPGILAWVVRACLEWQRHGLNTPAAVVDATREYEIESDPLHAFLDEACEIDPPSEVSATDLLAHYRAWADKHSLNDRGERLSAQAFGRKIGERFEHARTRSGKVYKGIARRSL